MSVRPFSPIQSHHGCNLFGAIEVTVGKLDRGAEETRTAGLLDAVHLLIAKDQSYSLAAKFRDDIGRVLVVLYKLVALVDIDEAGDRSWRAGSLRQI